jgi:hypothetical protein
MLVRIKGSITGVPYAQDKIRGDSAGKTRWSQAIIDQTADMPRIVGPCLMRVTFRLPPDKFPKDHPFGNDLDNLLKRFCDAIQQTILAMAPGRDGAIVSVEATKIRVESNAEAGADYEFIELQQPA